MHFCDRLWRCRSRDQDWPIAKQRLRPIERVLGHRAALGDRDRIDGIEWCTLPHVSDLRERRRRARAREHGCCAEYRGQAVGGGTTAEKAPAAEILGQTERNSRAAGDQLEVCGGFADRFEIVILDCIDYRVPKAGLPQRGKGIADGRRAPRHIILRHKPDLTAALPLQHAHQARIAHRGQRMVAHPGFREQYVADEEIAAVDCPPGFGKGRAEQGEIGGECDHQRLGNRADIAGIGRIEGRAILEQDLLRPGALQPAERCKALRDRVGGRDRPAFQCDDDGLGVGDIGAERRHVDQLDRAHTAPHQGVA